MRAERGQYRHRLYILRLNRKDRDRSVNLRALANFERRLVSRVHHCDVSLASTEENPSGMAGLHGPVSAVNVAIRIGDPITNLGIGSFAISLNDRLGDPLRHFRRIVLLHRCAMSPHECRRRVSVRGADQHLVRLQCGLL